GAGEDPGRGLSWWHARGREPPHLGQAPHVLVAVPAVLTGFMAGGAEAVAAVPRTERGDRHPDQTGHLARRQGLRHRHLRRRRRMSSLVHGKAPSRISGAGARGHPYRDPAPVIRSAASLPEIRTIGTP